MTYHRDELDKELPPVVHDLVKVGVATRLVLVIFEFF